MLLIDTLLGINEMKAFYLHGLQGEIYIAYLIKCLNHINIY